MNFKAIPGVPMPGNPRDKFDAAVKESLEILTGQRGNMPALVDPSQFAAADAMFGTDQIFTLQMERTSTGAAAQYMAMGNGAATGLGAIFPFDVEVLYGTLYASAITGTFTVQVSADGVALGAGYQMSVTGSGGNVSDMADWRASPPRIIAGKPINLYQAVVSTAVAAQVAMLFLRRAR